VLASLLQNPEDGKSIFDSENCKPNQERLVLGKGVGRRWLGYFFQGFKKNAIEISLEEFFQRNPLTLILRD
jgi:hypothetical protein